MIAQMASMQSMMLLYSEEGVSAIATLASASPMILVGDLHPEKCVVVLESLRLKLLAGRHPTIFY